ncbi:MAG: hypothetical protein IJ506_02205 [Clostridia bacterium]|nr:hypothetical protein [Clostridia bacterium]
MKRKVFRSKDDFEMMIDADTYRANQAPTPLNYSMGVNRGQIKAGVYMQPNGQPVMIMPLIASGTPTIPVAPETIPVVTPEKKRRK